MTKDEALAFDLALEALESERPYLGPMPSKTVKAITAIKQARALDKMAENARELGLDHEPAGGTQVSKVWWDGEKLMAKPIPLEDMYQTEPVQEFVAWIDLLKQAEEIVRSKSLWKKYIDGTPLANDIAVWMASFAQEHTTPPAQPAPVPLTDEEIIKAMPGGIYDCLNDPWDCGVGDGDTLRSIKKDVLRIARAIEAAHGITEKGQP